MSQAVGKENLTIAFWPWPYLESDLAHGQWRSLTEQEAQASSRMVMWQNKFLEVDYVTKINWLQEVEARKECFLRRFIPFIEGAFCP